MHEEARVRDEIQERTGVSSRGFLIPQKKVRKEVQGMLSAGNQRQLMVDDEDGTSAVAATGATPSDVSFASRFPMYKYVRAPVGVHHLPVILHV